MAGVRQRPDILSVERDGLSVTLQIALDAELIWFAGHFDELPILPGVVQLRWAAEQAAEQLDCTDATTSLRNVKFQRILQPGMTVSLILTRCEDASRVDFTYRNDDRVFSTGQLLYPAESP